MPRKKQLTEEFGNQFIEFLRNTGALESHHDDVALSNLVGAPGIVTSGHRTSRQSSGTIKVRIGEQEYHAHSGLLEEGTQIRVVEKRGLSLYVEPVETERTALVDH